MIVADGSPTSSWVVTWLWHFARFAGRAFRREMVRPVDDEEHTAPSRLIEEVDDDASQFLDPLDRRRLRRRRISPERPIDHERATLDHRARHGAPVARVAGAVAVVAHCEIRVRLHRVRPELVARAIG